MDILNASQIEQLTRYNDITFFGKKHFMKNNLPSGFGLSDIEAHGYPCIWELVEEEKRYEHDKRKNVRYTAWYDSISKSFVLFEDDELTAYVSAFGTASVGKNAIIVNKYHFEAKKCIWF